MRRLILLAIILMSFGAMYGQWLINENFDSISALPTGWTTRDDGDGMIWRNLNNASHANSGTRAAFCDNYLPNQNADWLITPQLSISAGDSLHFYTRSWISTEPLKVYISTAGTMPGNFNTQIINLTGIGTTYQLVSQDLSAFAGQNIYIGFLWNCQNYGILIDDIRIGHPLIIDAELELPESFTFFQGESLNIDFTPFVTTTDLATASLTVSGNTNVQVTINSMQVSLSSPEFNGVENLTFTLHDGSSGQSDEDAVQIIVAPEPAVDLVVTAISSPREFQYQGLAFNPGLTVVNNGTVVFNDVLQVNCVITDESGAAVYSETAFQNVMIEPEGSSGVSFSQEWIPTELGTYTASFTVANEDGNPTNNNSIKDFTVVYRVTQGGPDAFGYSFIDSNAPGGPVFDWIEISETGTSSIMYNVPTFEGDDNFSEPVPLGFSFPFYGYNYTEAYVDINGELLLAENNWYDEYPGLSWDNDGNMFNYQSPIPGYAQMPGLIAVYWDDLLAVEGSSDIFFQSFGTAPERYAVIQWNNLKFLAGSGGTPSLKFQVILHEDGEIVMQYHTVNTGHTPGLVPHESGRSATVAVQNATADIGLAYLREIVQNNTYMGVEPAGNLLHDGLAIRFFNDEDTQAPVIVHTAPGNTFENSFTLSASIVDFSEIASAQLHYNTGDGWQSVVPSQIQGNLYSFAVTELPLGSTFNYYFSAEDVLDNASTLPAAAPNVYYSFKILPTLGAQALIVYSGSQDYQRTELPVYEDLLQSQEVTYDIFNWEEFLTYTIPTQYQALFVYATTGGGGDKSLQLSSALIDYMESGTIQEPKNVFFASDGWAADSHALPNDNIKRKFNAAYLRMHYVASGTGGGTNGLAGPDVYSYQNGTLLRRASSPIGTQNTEYAVYANSPDCIFYYDEVVDTYADQVQYPEIGSVAAFTFQDGPIGGNAYLLNGVAAVALDLPIYKSFYFSFDFSQISDPVQRYELMEDLVEWFGIEPVSTQDNQIVPTASGINRIYPNPFNPRSTIEFSLGQAGPVRVDVFNLKGQKVKSLASGNYPAGVNSLIWDGTDDAGRGVASGIYYVRMNADNRNYSRRVVLVK
ncbi:MAG: choice-of-anchor J domain-containing protein [Candidatus Cloacimonadota bacterium]